ncbi:MAG TPA: hypothetical protein DEF45_04410 [Rhodopirellula sp.]|nr:hypothetical protein [Rhodopirellula sp.]
MVAVDTENNPYSAPCSVSASSPEQKTGVKPEPTNGNPAFLRLGHIFAYSYIPSFVVSLAVVPAWIWLLISATPPQFRRTRGPEIVELIFILATTLPNVLTCLAFQWCYCVLRRTKKRPNAWPAVVFGILSGLVFNGITSITVLEYFFKW